MGRIENNIITWFNLNELSDLLSTIDYYIDRETPANKDQIYNLQDKLGRLEDMLTHLNDNCGHHCGAITQPGSQTPIVRHCSCDECHGIRNDNDQPRHNRP